MNDITQIENYLAGELSQDEWQAFEMRLQTDKEFAEIFALYKTIETEMTITEDETALREKLSVLTQKHFEAPAPAKIIPMKSGRKKWWLYAAAAAAIAIIFLLKPWQEKTLSDEQLYAQYAVATELPEVVRGANDDSLLIKATNLFNQKKFAAALPLLDSISKQKPGEAQLQLSLGICLVETGNFDAAINKFDSLAAGQTIYKYEAIAWKGFAFLKQNKREACVAALKQIPAGAANYEKAKELIRMLSKK